MSQTLTKPILLDETGQAIKTALQNIDETESQDWLLTYEDVHSEMDDNIKKIADSVSSIKDIMAGSEGEPTSIIIVTPPTKTKYRINEVFDISGAIICANVTNGLFNSLVDITETCTYDTTPISLTTESVQISWTFQKTSQTFTTSQPIEVLIPSWSDATDTEVVALLQAHYDDSSDFDICDYWSIGEERTVHLSAATPASGGVLSEQDIVLVLSEAGGKTLTTPIGNHTECAFQVDAKNVLLDSYLMQQSTSSTNAGGWRDCLRRTWCNDTFYNAFPITLKDIFKSYKNKTGLGGDSTTLAETDDYFALHSEVEITGSNSISTLGEGEQITYYKTSSNKIKGGSTYYLRSPKSGHTKYWVAIDYDGTVNFSYFSLNISPFGVI